ncbi:response regulator [Falsirhodobacter deserti]|uniref:response regulator n=1 Tax=Falsirhodobacter deserti TaxID=1365611 RepID=UPI000FE3E386|nr:response regulator [Falsirhodobacter deserti]
MTVHAAASAGASRVLVVEDELLVAMLIEDYLSDLGYHVIGPAMKLDRAMDLAGMADLDFAVLDINLGQKLSFPVADILRSRNIPFIFATGGMRDTPAEHYPDAIVLPKPFNLADLERALGTAQLHLV